jgi:hypothetical protein
VRNHCTRLRYETVHQNPQNRLRDAQLSAIISLPIIGYISICAPARPARVKRFDSEFAGISQWDFKGGTPACALRRTGCGVPPACS